MTASCEHRPPTIAITATDSLPRDWHPGGRQLNIDPDVAITAADVALLPRTGADGRSHQ
jgi:hypothetical protein